MARANITVTSSAVAKIVPQRGTRIMEWKTSGNVLHSLSPRLSAGQGVTYAAGEGQTIYGDPQDAGRPHFFRAVSGNVTIEWDDGHDD